MVGYPKAAPERLAKGSKKAIQKYGDEEEGDEEKTTLSWTGFLKLYEDSYRKDPGALQVEFENRGFTLHKTDAPAKKIAAKFSAIEPDCLTRSLCPSKRHQSSRWFWFSTR